MPKRVKWTHVKYYIEDPITCGVKGCCGRVNLVKGRVFHRSTNYRPRKNGVILRYRKVKKGRRRKKIIEFSSDVCKSNKNKDPREYMFCLVGEGSIEIQVVPSTDSGSEDVEVIRVRTKEIENQEGGNQSSRRH